MGRRPSRPSRGPLVVAVTATTAATPTEPTTSEERAAERRVALVKELNADVRYSQDMIDSYLKLIASGSRDYLEMFQEISLVNAAARIRIISGVLDMLHKTASMDELRALVANEVMGGAMHPSTSSSAPMNTSHALQLAAWAYVADRIRWLGYSGSLTNIVHGDEEKCGHPGCGGTISTVVCDRCRSY